MRGTPPEYNGISMFERNRRINYDQIYQIIETYNKFNNITQTYMALDPSFDIEKSTIRKILRRFNVLKENTGKNLYGTKLPKEEIIRMIRLLEHFGGNVLEASRKTQHTHHTIEKLSKQKDQIIKDLKIKLF